MLPPGAEVRPYQVGDELQLLEDIRPLDREEAEALLGRPLTAADIRRSATRADIMNTVLVDGEVLGIGGAFTASVLDGAGVPWFLATTSVENHFGLLVKLGREHIPTLRQRYRRLENFVMASNTRAVRWLKAMGFEIYPPAPLGPRGIMFRKFSMES